MRVHTKAMCVCSDDLATLAIHTTDLTVDVYWLVEICEIPMKAKQGRKDKLYHLKLKPYQEKLVIFATYLE